MSYFEDQEELHDLGECDGAGCHLCQAEQDEAEQKAGAREKERGDEECQYFQTTN